MSIPPLALSGRGGHILRAPDACRPALYRAGRSALSAERVVGMSDSLVLRDSACALVATSWPRVRVIEFGRKSGSELQHGGRFR